MDWEYTKRELCTLGAWEFDMECASLSAQLFSAAERKTDWTKQELEGLDIYFTSGTFGTEAQALEKRLKAVSGEGVSGGKLRYVWRRMFPSVAYLSDMHPVLKKYPWLAPFIYLKRFVSVLFSRRNYVFRELRNLWKFKK